MEETNFSNAYRLELTHNDLNSSQTIKIESQIQPNIQTNKCIELFSKLHEKCDFTTSTLLRFYNHNFRFNLQQDKIELSILTKPTPLQ